ncbi:substrate-binding domain-containing protein [Amycolatopsis sp. NPDC050768]|uniref:substrate-binding domain-containing protein n=1 Tax=Amycolatopsis sp. NPDC050768 TaxID=3154839 RepID=UPI0033EBEBC0
MPRWRRTFALTLSAVTAAALAACSGGTSTSDSATKKFTVVYVPGVTQNPYFDTIKRSMEPGAARDGITLVHQGSPNFSATDQTRVLNAVLTQRPDLLVVAPVDPVAMRPPIQRFLSAGIPVLTVDGTLADPSGLVSQIHGNGLQGGRLAGRQMAQYTGGTGTVAIINIMAGNTSLDQRVEGFEAGLREAAPNVRIAPVNNAGGNPSGSQAAARSLLVAYPDLKGIYGVTEVNAEGAAAALTAAGRTGSVPIVAYDGTPTEVKYLRDKSLQYLVVQNAKAAGETAIRFASAYLRGDKAAVKPEVTLDAVGADLETIDHPDVKELLYGPAIN